MRRSPTWPRRDDVFAKLSPIKRPASIGSLKAHGHTVGFLGDGINDAPALAEADVGISVDTAVDIAKEAADIILLEKSLLVLEQGVIEGRQRVRQRHQVHQDDRQLEFRKRLQRARGQRVPAFPAHAGRANPGEQFPLRLLPDRHPEGPVDEDFFKQPRQWNIGNIATFMMHRSHQLDLRLLTFRDLMWFFGALAKQSLFQSGWFVVGLLTQTLIVHMIRTGRFRSSKAGRVCRCC